MTKSVRPAAIVLAGGNGSRFSNENDKLLASVGGASLLERVVDSCLVAGVGQVVLCVKDMDRHAARIEVACQCAEAYDVPVVAVQDLDMPGPVGGVQAAHQLLANMAVESVYIVAADLPFLSPALLQRLRRSVDHTDALVAALESTDGEIDPSCSYWKLRALKHALDRATQSRSSDVDCARGISLRSLTHHASSSSRSVMRVSVSRDNLDLFDIDFTDDLTKAQGIDSEL